jgi:hypothetical protein
MPNKDRNIRNGLGGRALAAVLLAVILVNGGIFWAAANLHRPGDASNSSSVRSQPAAGTTGSGGRPKGGAGDDG